MKKTAMMVMVVMLSGCSMFGAVKGKTLVEVITNPVNDMESFVVRETAANVIGEKDAVKAADVIQQLRDGAVYLDALKAAAKK